MRFSALPQISMHGSYHLPANWQYDLTNPSALN
nr:MAG TPA: hypothetical protein [Caudoviricetes sp.]DAN98632.1 MAG TPA: hypothetical protein [Caudoviricetes sp.]